MRVAFLKEPLPGAQYWAAHHLGKLVDHSPYSHGQLIFSSGMSGSAWADGGVQIRSLGYEPGQWDFYTTPGIDESRAHKWFAENKAAPYDSLGVMRFGLSLLRESEDRYFCWEAITTSFGWTDPWRFGPGATRARLIDLGAIQVDGPWEPVLHEGVFA